MKTYKILYWIFAVVGLLGFIDLMTQVIAKQEVGYIGIGFLYLFGSSITVIVIGLFALWPLWLVFAYSLRRKMKKTNFSNKSS